MVNFNGKVEKGNEIYRGGILYLVGKHGGRIIN